MSNLNDQDLNQSSSIAKLLRQTKLDYEGMNNTLLKNIQTLDTENTQLKSAILELQKDLEAKDDLIDESHKKITKLKEEYFKLIKEYQTVSTYNAELGASNEQSKKTVDDMCRSQQNLEKAQKKFETVITENEKLKKENIYLKSQLTNKGTVASKSEKDLKDKEMIINDLKERTENWLVMIKERERLLLESNMKIKELNEIIIQKDEQLKVMVNFSKEINNENKTNVAELTKQATKTLKIFYNTLNNNNKEQIDNALRIEFNNSDTTFSDFEQIFKGKKVTFELEDALNGLMYIPSGLKSINKEFLMDMNFKTELIKSELYSGLIRESTFAQFLNDVFVKLNVKDSESIETLCSKVNHLKMMYENITKENEDLRKINKGLLENKRNFDLYSKKLRDDMRHGLEKMKEKFNGVEKGLDMQLNAVMEENKNLNEKYKKDTTQLKGDIAALRNENMQHLKEIDLLNQTIQQLKIQNENANNLNRQTQLNMSMNLHNNNNNNNSKTNDVLNKRLVIKYWNDVNRFVAYDSFNFFSSVIARSSSNNNLPHNQQQQQMSHLQNNLLMSDNDKSNITHDYNPNNSLNESVNERNYSLKNKEILKLKDEISKMKGEMSNLLSLKSQPQQPFQSQSQTFSSQQQQQPENDPNIRNNNTNININSTRKLLSDLQGQLAKEQDKNHLVIRELNDLKLYCKDIENRLHDQPQAIESHFTPKFFLTIFCDVNSKIFSSSELKKYYTLYNAKNIFGIIEIFHNNCEAIKRQIYESHFDMDTSYTEIDESFMTSKNGRHQQEQRVNNSYRLVNERIIRLKKFEFDFSNLCDFIKNYMVAQEIVVKMLFGQNSMIELDPIEDLFNIFEDALNFRIDDMTDDMIFNRKIMLRMLKNQKMCLCLSLQ